MTPRRGFTLVELLVAVVILSFVGAATYSILINTQRVSRRQTERSDLQADVRAGTLILPAELREIGYDNQGKSDLLMIAKDSIRFRAMRGAGTTCQVNALSNELIVRTPLLGVGQTPARGDVIMVFVEGDSTIAFDDYWIHATVMVTPTTTTCPDGESAIKITIGPSVATPVLPVPMTQVKYGGPVRFFDRIQMGLYTSDGKPWLGARLSGDLTYQPVLGPLASGNGLEFTYYDVRGVEVPVSGTKDSVATVEITLRGRSDEPVWLGPKGGPKIDSLNMTTRVSLRNVAGVKK